jgi:hypothetical protein
MRVAFRPAGGAWRRASSTGFADAELLAFDAKGDAIVVRSLTDGWVWVVTSQVRSAGGVWHRPVTIGYGPGSGCGVASLAVNSRGDAVAAWLHDRPGGAECSVVQAVFKPAGGSWRRPVALNPTADAGGGVQVALANSGMATAVWTDSGGVQTSSKPRGGAWSRPVTLTGPDNQKLDSLSVGVNPLGGRLAVWGCSGGSCESGLLSPGSSATATPHVRWYAPVTFAAGESPTAAFDSHGNVVVVWIHALNAGQPVLDIPPTSVVEAATFTRGG